MKVKYYQDCIEDANNKLKDICEIVNEVKGNNIGNRIKSKLSYFFSIADTHVEKNLIIIIIRDIRNKISFRIVDISFRIFENFPLHAPYFSNFEI